MTVQKLLSRSTPPLRPDDSIEHALGLMMELRLRHLPVVDAQGMLAGVISEDQLLDGFDPGAEIQALLGPRPISAGPDHHVFDVTKIIVEHDLTALPIADEAGTYVGVVRRHDIFEQFAKMLSTQESGSILALEVEPRDYALARLVHTIEQNDVKVLSIASEPPEVEHDVYRVTIKLNVTDSARVRHMLEHNGYHVIAAFGESTDEEELLFRVQEFMRYLEV